MATIKDVAEASGYSVCTVSKAISGKGYIRDSTREKILKVVKEIGYSPNHLAVSLKTGRTYALALIVPDVTNIYFPRLEKYVERYAEEKGYMVYLCNANHDLEREKKFIESFSQGRVDGVLITPCSEEHRHIQKLQETEIPYLILNRSYEDDRDHCLPLDNEKGAYVCVTYLLEHGYRKIGGVFQSFSNSSHRDRYRGVMRAIEKHGCSLDEMMCLFGMDDLEMAHVQIGQLLSRENRPEAIFAANDMLALSVYQAAYEQSLRIPDDLAVVGYDNSIIADKLAPKLTSFYQPAKECSRCAVDYITAAIEGRELPPLQMLEGELVERESVGDRQPARMAV